MPSINKCIVFLTLALSATAFGSSHVARSNHRGLARNARPDVLANVVPPSRRARSNAKRCKSKPSSPSSSTPSSSKKAVKETPPPPHKDASAYTPKAETTTSSSKPKPTTPSNNGGNDNGNNDNGGDNGGNNSGGNPITGGIATFYSQNGNAGACGQTHSDSDIICALESSTYANGAHCGQHVLITNLKNGKTVKVLVADECPTCKNHQSIDLSTGAYKALGGTVDEGIFDISWIFV